MFFITYAMFHIDFILKHISKLSGFFDISFLFLNDQMLKSVPALRSADIFFPLSILTSAYEKYDWFYCP